jgi:hypothetical protein
MSHPDGLLDPALQQGHPPAGTAADAGHHPGDYSHPADYPHAPAPAPATGHHAQGGHSIQDIQASQILSHFQFAPAGSAAGGSLPPAHAAATGLDSAAGGGQGTTGGPQQSLPSATGPAFDPYAVFTSSGVQPGDGPIDGSGGGAGPLAGGHPHHAQAHGHLQPHQQQQQQLASDFGAFDAPQQLQHSHQQVPGGLQAQTYGSTGGPSTGARNGHFLQHHHQQPLDQTLNKRPYDTLAAPLVHTTTDDTGAGTESDGNDADVDDIHDLTYLRREVKRLRRALRHSALPAIGLEASGGPAAYGHGLASQQADYYGSSAPSIGVAGSLVAETSAVGARRSGNVGGRRSKKVDDLDEEEKRKRNALTGKRETTPRHHALNVRPSCCFPFDLEARLLSPAPSFRIVFMLVGADTPPSLTGP